MKDLARIDSYIDRSYYQKTLDELRTEHDSSYYIGKINPYSGKKIETEHDVEFYLQQLAMSVMYRQAANMALSKIHQDTKQQIESLEDEVLDLQAEQKGYLSEIGDVRSQLREMERKKGRAKLIAILLAVFLGLSAYPQLSSRSRSYTSINTQPTITAAQSTLSTATPFVQSTATVKPKPTTKPKSTATPKPKTATYKTTPRAGIDLTRTVYVSKSGGKIHLRSNCSGMKNYYTMTYGEACEKGYDHCKKCFK